MIGHGGHFQPFPSNESIAMSHLLEILGRGLLVELRAAFRDILSSGGQDTATAREKALQSPDDPESLYSYGVALLDIGELQRARTAFEQVLSLDATHHCARIGLACALDSLGLTQNAAEQLHACLHDNLNPAESSRRSPMSNAAIVFAIAYCQERLGDTSGALIRYEQCLKLVAGLRSAHERMAAIHFQAGDIRAAIGCYQVLCALVPGDLDVVMTLANLHLQNGDYGAALAQYENAIMLDPDNWATTDQFVEMCIESGRLDEAIVELNRRIQECPNAADQHLRLGDLYHKSGRPLDAERAYDRALAVNPEYLEATIKSGTARLRRGDFDGAAALFARAVEINDRITTAYVGLAVAHGALGEPERTAECFETASGIGANSALLFSEIARMELTATAGMQSRKYLDPVHIARCPHGPADDRVVTLIDRQIENIRRSLRQNPDHADLCYRLGVLLENKGEWDAALGAYEDATRLNPQYLKAQTRRALILHRLARFAEATETARGALSIDPESVELHYHLGLLFSDQRRFDAALDHFEFSANQAPDRIEYTAHLALALQQMGLLDRADETRKVLRDIRANQPENHPNPEGVRFER